MIETILIMFAIGLLGIPAWVIVVWIAISIISSIQNKIQKTREDAFIQRIREVEHKAEKLDNRQPKILQEASRIINQSTKGRD